MSLVPIGPGVDHAYATAARVDENAVGHAWGCIHAPGEAQAAADGVDRDSDLVTVNEVTIDGDMVRVELSLPEVSQGRPAEAEFALSGVTMFGRGF